MSSIEYDENNLSPVHYEKLLQAIQQALRITVTDSKDDYLFTKADSLAFDIDKVAATVGKQFKTGNYIPFEVRDGLNFATVHALDINEKTDFSHDLQHKVIEELAEQLLKRMQSKLQHSSLERYATALLAPIDTFIKNQAKALSYPLNKEHTLQRQNIHASDGKDGQELWLKAHKLTLSVTNIGSFNEQIAKSINAYIEQYPGCDEDDIADTHENLEVAQNQQTSNLNQLKEIIVKESVARIQREARVCYLRYLGEGMFHWRRKDFKQGQSDSAKQVEKAIILLGNLILRLQALDAYIRQADKEYSHYTVFLHKNEFNYRDIFARADAFSPLPIITEIDGFLGENTDQQRQAKTFISGVKLKLNGAVHNHGGKGHSVFDFNMALLDPSSSEYQAREKASRRERSFYEKVLKVALLYCFVFVEMENKDFRPGLYFEEHILPALQSNDDHQAITALQKLKRTITQNGVTENLTLLRNKLKEFLHKANIGPERKTYDKALTLDKSILTKDVNQIIQGNFFQETFDQRNGRNALKYIAVTSDAPDPNTLSRLPIKMAFEPIYYYPTEKPPEHFTMCTQTAGIEVLPTFLAPVDQQAPDKYKTVYQGIKRIAFYYRHRPQVHTDSPEAFAYRFTYALLAYTMIKLLADSLPTDRKSKLFAPIICIHANAEQAPDEKGEKYDDESFMHALAKQLAHLLSADYMSGSQGFQLDTVMGNNYKLGNALYSLYSALPHTFHLQQTQAAPANNGARAYQLNKLAIIVVSSRKSDENLKAPDYYEACIIGKVVGIERQLDDTITVRTLNTFSANQNSKELFSRPDVIIEQVKKYQQQGYQHFLYVAHAPYTSTLNISDSGNSELFFMNKDIIQAMRAVDQNIKIYPTFCDKYYVINRKAAQKKLLHPDSLYIDDIRELSKVSNDPTRRSQLFFNLFNGITVNKDTVYNGVMSYATLINVYDDDPSYDQYIWNDLLNDSANQSLKTELLDFITLLHFSRYEKASQKDNPVAFKLDPYTDIIGDKSVGALSIFPHMTGRARFNSLAFLNVVRAILHTTYK
ncbi:hypothetical protein EPA93_34125 [Ktedonosporobacter rubrisoli]|uniref:Uncharacterized protein n=1 Tax=Ktedonosporobacter rubrisoli TaxID=2509675 RepID=A0A4P6JY64_KTERU|nr:hypothetical protein [Ktedonosporobacter rubrisoli]QBD80738.1 hypothetical protein EPA93_34125 [Ktedonosporobacter rubrisoli]